MLSSKNYLQAALMQILIPLEAAAVEFNEFESISLEI